MVAGIATLGGAFLRSSIAVDPVQTPAPPNQIYKKNRCAGTNCAFPKCPASYSFSPVYRLHYLRYWGNLLCY